MGPTIRLALLLPVATVVFLVAASSAPGQTAKTKAIAATEKGVADTDPALLDLTGYNQTIGKYRGKPLMVNFWATWCEPCREEYPMIVDLSKKFGPEGLVVLGVSLDENADLNLVRRFLAENHPGFPNFRQKPGIDADAFYQGVNPDWRGTMPQTVFYGRDGHIARYLVGSRPRSAFEDAIRLIMVNNGAQDLKDRSAQAGH
jgi:thiol-disulfide isomerase/thioredoxin